MNIQPDTAALPQEMKNKPQVEFPRISFKYEVVIISVAAKIVPFKSNI